MTSLEDRVRIRKRMSSVVGRGGSCCVNFGGDNLVILGCVSSRGVGCRVRGARVRSNVFYLVGSGFRSVM